jgi:hypothetical protein
MNRSIVVAVALLSTAALADEPWKESARADVAGRPLVVYSRARAGSDVQEVRGQGSFDAPPWIIKNVIDDVGRYSEFMPYTAKSKVLSKGDGFVVSYQRLAVPLADDRDYTIKIFDESKEDAAGHVVWKNRWTSANKLGPAPIDGVVRVGVNEGYWELRELDGGKHTQASYYVYTNPGGAMPAFLVNAANTQAVPDLFKSVARAAADPRYQKTRPTPRTSAKQPAAPPPTTPTTPTTTTTTPTTPPAEATP